jgi:hypothetical protein
MKTNKSKCRTCGEKLLETGNYQVKIIKGKRIPKKLQKLIKTGMINNEQKKSTLRQSKFGQFLLKRSQISNEVVSELLFCYIIKLFRS